MIYEPIKFDSFEARKEYFYNNYQDILGKPIVDKLIAEGFLTAPASTKYHGNYPGGLFDHSVNVAEVLTQLTANNDLKWDGERFDPDGLNRSPKIIGLLHDLCKIDSYKPTPEGSQFPYEHDNSPIVKGHGTKSLIYIHRFGLIRLTEEEAYCIIYHMGAYTPKEEWQDYNNAVNKCPNVLWTHVADMIASQIMLT